MVAWISEEPGGPGMGVTPETDFQRTVHPQRNSETADDGAVPETQRPIFYILPREGGSIHAETQTPWKSG